MDAGDCDTWQIVNRPAHVLYFEKHLEKIDLFNSSYNGLLCTETMIIEGLNDSVENFSNLAELIKNLNPGKAYLAIPIRPPAVESAIPTDAETLNLAWQIFNKSGIKTEFLTGFEGNVTGFTGNIYEDILNITAVHPLREDSLQKLLEKDNADYQIVESLIKQKLIRSTLYQGHRFFLREYHINI
jgi:wyosine [tRNA(Phe)-imidazoG37] synthetase (radical SAM superfamily)